MKVDLAVDSARGVLLEYMYTFIKIKSILLIYLHTRKSSQIPIFIWSLVSKKKSAKDILFF